MVDSVVEKTEKKGRLRAFAASRSVLIVAFLAFQGGVVGLSYLVFSSPNHTESEQMSPEEAAANAPANEEEKVEEELQEGEELLGALLPLETFLVNIKNGGFLRCEVQLEFDSRDLPKKVHARIAYMRDGIISIIGQKTKDQLLDSKGKEVLREDIKTLANEVLREQAVKRILFSQYIVQ